MRGSVRVRGLTKRFVRYTQSPPRTLKRRLLHGFRSSLRDGSFAAVDDVSLDVQPGSMLGVIGHNGSGKSTLLRIIGGVMKADSGQVGTSGRVSGLLALNSGMHLELSGRENILIGSVIAGLTKREAFRRMDEIIEFAELRHAIDNPVRTYSTGMRMRLGFAVASHTDPDVLLIDEVLSVGDIAFQNKCMDLIRTFRDRGCAILLVTHDLSQVEKLCDQAIWLNSGRVAARGTPDVALAAYRSAVAEQTRKMSPTSAPDEITAGGTTLRLNDNRFGSLELRITSVRLTDDLGAPIDEIVSGGPLTVHVDYEGASQTAPVVGVAITTAEGRECLDLNTLADEVAMPATGSGGSIRLDLERLDLAAGDYFINIGLYRPDWEYAYDYHWHAYPLKIVSQLKSAGILTPPRRWTALPKA